VSSALPPTQRFWPSDGETAPCLLPREARVPQLFSKLFPPLVSLPSSNIFKDPGFSFCFIEANLRLDTSLRRRQALIVISLLTPPPETLLPSEHEHRPRGLSPFPFSYLDASRTVVEFFAVYQCPPFLSFLLYTTSNLSD